MPLQNRVTPFGAIIAHPARGAWMGNRGGRIHDPSTRRLTRRWASRRWIICVLEFKGRRRAVMGAGYTELFFLDEATALAAGHRPCFECRRGDAKAFADAWMRARGLRKPPSADEMDDALHRERLAIFNGARRPAGVAALADGVFVSDGEDAFRIAGGGLERWTMEGYRPGAAKGSLFLLTPPSTTAAIAAGYAPQIGPSAPSRPL